MEALYNSLLARLVDGLVVLPDKPDETPERALRSLWHAAAGRPSAMPAEHPTPLAWLHPPQQDLLAMLVERRLAGEPLAYLTGRQAFLGLDMLSGPAALIPRAETEQLAQAAIELAAAMPGAPCVVDVCAGSGNLAYAIAHYVPQARVLAADLSPEALQLAERNGHHLGLADRVELLCGDLLAPAEAAGLRGQVDLITSAPPYIQTAKVPAMAHEIAAYEPRMAFDGGPLGVAILLRLVEESPPLLRAGGWLAMEVGLGQGPAMARRLQRGPAFDRVRELADAGGATRVLLARRSASA